MRPQAFRHLRIAFEPTELSLDDLFCLRFEPMCVAQPGHEDVLGFLRHACHGSLLRFATSHQPREADPVAKPPGTVRQRSVTAFSWATSTPSDDSHDRRT